MNPGKIVQDYFPMQPGFFSETDNYIEKEAPWSLHSNQQVIFFQFTIKACSSFSMPIVPDGCFDIIFNCNPNHPDVNIYGKLIQGKRDIYLPKCLYFGVRLFLKQTIKHLPYSMKELIGEIAPLQDCLKIGSDFYENMAMRKTFEERILYFQHYVEHVGIELENNTGIAAYCIDRICFSHGNLSIAKLAAETGYTIRSLRNKFEEFVGITPKRFSQIIRFQNCLKMISQSHDVNLEDVMFDNGFYDQAHLFKDFKIFSYCTPAQIREKCPPSPTKAKPHT